MKTKSSPKPTETVNPAAKTRGRKPGQISLQLISLEVLTSVLPPRANVMVGTKWLAQMNIVAAPLQIITPEELNVSIESLENSSGPIFKVTDPTVELAG